MLSRGTRVYYADLTLRDDDGPTKAVRCDAMKLERVAAQRMTVSPSMTSVWVWVPAALECLRAAGCRSSRRGSRLCRRRDRRCVR